MLREITRVSQQDPDVRRRWFRDDYFDIFVWQNADGHIVSLQLCYDLPAYERVLSWRESKGYSHHRVDGGEASPIKNRTPIMVPDGAMPFTAVLTEFDARAAEVDAAVRASVRERLLDYAGGEATRVATKIDKLPPGV